MKIFYLCQTGLHIGLVAAGLHLGKLPAGEIPPGKAIINLSREYRRTGFVLGKPLFVGRDEAGYDVFTIGVAAQHIMMKKAVEDLLTKVYQMNSREFLVVDTTDLANGWVKLGSLLSIRFNMPGAGEKICAFGLRKSYVDIVQRVEKVKSPLECSR